GLSRRVRIHHRGLEWLLDLHPGTGIAYQETEHGCRPEGGSRESPAERTLLGHRVLPTVRVRKPLWRAAKQGRDAPDGDGGDSVWSTARTTGLKSRNAPSQFALRGGRPYGDTPGWPHENCPTLGRPEAPLGSPIGQPQGPALRTPRVSAKRKTHS